MTNTQVGDKILATDKHGNEITGIVERVYSDAERDYLQLTGGNIGLNRKLWVVEVLEQAKPPIGSLIKGTLDNGVTFTGLVIHPDYMTAVLTYSGGNTLSDVHIYWTEILGFEVVG